MWWSISVNNSSIWKWQSYKCTKKLRRDILNLENKVLEEPLGVEDILKGEVEMPDPVKNFYKALCTGDKAEKPISSRKFRFVESSISEAIYSCSGGMGRLLPGKHLSLGFVVKPLTGRKNVVTLMNRYGHYVSSETIPRIDMSLEVTITDKENVVPDGLENYPSSQRVPLGTIATLSVKNPQVKTPFTTHTRYATKIKSKETVFKIFRTYIDWDRSIGKQEKIKFAIQIPGNFTQIWLGLFLNTLT